jgi:hypothetical protein
VNGADRVHRAVPSILGNVLEIPADLFWPQVGRRQFVRALQLFRRQVRRGEALKRQES